MKKNIILILSLLFFITGNAQFKVSGEIRNYAEQSIMIRIFNGSEDKLINKVTTDKNGKFTVKIPKRYSGIVRLVSPSAHSSMDLLTDNENIQFSAEIEEDKFTDIAVTEGENTKGYELYKNYESYHDLKINVFPIVKALYTKEDEFYKAMEKEENRIAKLAPNLELPLLKYYIQVFELSNAQVDTKQSAEVYKNKILGRLVNDNNYLEGTSLMTSLVLNYMRYSIFDAQNQEEINLTLEKEIDNLLEKTDLETPRGQNVLSSIFMVLPADQFSTLLNKYYDKANALTCEITDDLKGKITAHKQMVVGNQVPNITFDKPIKGNKSLYDIKANKKLIIFWASWCPACQDEMPYIKEYYRNFKQEGGEIISISLDFDETAFKEATKDFEWINYTELAQWDTQGVVEFGVAQTPTLFLIDKDNKLVKTASHISELVEL